MLSSDKDHLQTAQQAAIEASARAMKNPRKFAKPCTMTALAVAMATPLSVIVRTSISNTIAACVGAKDTQSKVRQYDCVFLGCCMWWATIGLVRKHTHACTL